MELNSEVKTEKLIRTLNIEVPYRIGDKVLLKGWVSQWRDLKKMSFCVLRDRTGYTQVFVPKNLGISLLPETVVEIVGYVKEEKQSRYGGVEIVAEQIIIVSETEPLPFPINREEELPFDTLYKHRPITIRKEKERCIFKIQAGIIKAFRSFFERKDFTEIFSTKLSGSGMEGGSEMFNVEYFDKSLCLTQSPQFYKQMMVGSYERVFEVGKVYRAEGSDSNRHMTEYIGLDVEMGFINSAHDVMDIEEEFIQYLMLYLTLEYKEELDYLNVDLDNKINNIPRINYSDIDVILKEETRLLELFKSNGINAEIERYIGTYVKNKHNSDFVFIYNFPIDEKPFYTMPSESGSESFDLLYKGMEITSGGQRIHSYKMLLEALKNKGLNADYFESYLMPFKHGMPPHGGFGMGLERLMMIILNLENVQEASLIPRTKERYLH